MRVKAVTDTARALGYCLAHGKRQEGRVRALPIIASTALLSATAASSSANARRPKSPGDVFEAVRYSARSSPPSRLLTDGYVNEDLIGQTMCTAREHPERRNLVVSALCAIPLLAAAWPHPARADVVISTDPLTGCSVKVSNEITAADALRVRSSDCPEAILDLSGPGGDVYAAMEIGRWAREREAIAAIYTGSYCYSSCALIFISGVARPNLGEIGVHRPYFAGAPLSEADVARSVRTMLGDIRDYIEEMGVTSEFANVMINTPPSEVRIYRRGEIHSLVPEIDPLYDEVKVARAARYYGLSTDEYRKRHQEADERCAINDLIPPEHPENPPSVLPWVECKAAVYWGLSQTAYQARAKGFWERCIEALTLEEFLDTAAEEVDVCRIEVMQGRR